MDNWALPEYIEDVLPPQAWRLETLRRTTLDVLRAHGYQLVMPPLLEYLESLLIGTGHDLDLATFKLVDQLSGRHMGVRADITPQAARIDAHLMNRRGVDRLCYTGSVLRTKPEGLMRTREPFQVGAELFGHAGVEGDAEIQQLMLEVLAGCGIERIVLDLGHVGIFGALARHAALPEALERELFEALQSKDSARVAELVQPLEAQSAAAFRRLSELSGGDEVIAQAMQSLPALPEVRAALEDLRHVSELLNASAAAAVKVTFDLAELRGYDYHSGMVFAAYAPGYADAIAKGGRYDEVGKAFGRARAATGFSLDLRDIVNHLPPAHAPRAILAPPDADEKLQQMVRELRAKGEVVIRDLPGHEADRAELGCDRQIVLDGGRWQVRKLG
jgi:ATP phosphoribosyltransferase regulatory subunit